MSRHIYLDNSATTKICDEALNKYIEVSRECYGNPSSLHGFGFEAERVLDGARREVRASLGAKNATVTFCASGSEANNLAILGRAFAKERYKRGAKIITTEGEHASVNEPLSKLMAEGFKVVKIPTLGGEIDMQALEREMTPDVILVTMMMVNNETGAYYDIPAVSRIMRQKSKEALLHVDATQSYLKIPFSISSLGADMITVSSHKIEGPKGVGALVSTETVKRTRGISPIIFGGGQEEGLRSGTENVPAIAAFGEAVRLGSQNVRANYAYLSSLREKLISLIEGRSELSDISVTKPKRHAPHILNVTLPGIKSETMLHYLSSLGIYVSSGSACSSNGHASSPALIAFGRSEKEADCSIRISLSHRNTDDDITALVEALVSGLERLARIK